MQDQQKRLSGEPSPDDSPEATDEKDTPNAASSAGHPWLAYTDTSGAASTRRNTAEEEDGASVDDSFVVIDEALSNALRNASVTQVSDFT